MYNVNEEYKYIVIRAKNEYVKTRINKLKVNNYTQLNELSLVNVPNASIISFFVFTKGF